MTMSPAGAAPYVPVAAPAASWSASACALAGSRLTTSTVCPALTIRPAIAVAMPPEPMMLIVLICSFLVSWGIARGATLLFAVLVATRLPAVSSSAGREVMTIVQIGEQPGLNGFPAEGLAGDEVGRGEVQRDQIRKESKVPRQHQYVRGNAYDRQAQTAANGLGDLAKPDAFALNPVPSFASRPFLQRQAEQRGEVAAVHGRPQVRAVSGVADDALLLCEPNQQREEPGIIGRAVRDSRNPHDRGPHAPFRKADYRELHDVTNP